VDSNYAAESKKFWRTEGDLKDYIQKKERWIAMLTICLVQRRIKRKVYRTAYRKSRDWVKV